MSEVANKRRLAAAVDALIRKRDVQLEDIDAACEAFSAVLTDLFGVPMALRLDADSKALEAKLNELDPTHDL